jgi:hypothetical protein
LYTYFSRERKSRKVSTCYRSKRAFGDLETFVTGELKSRANSTGGTAYFSVVSEITPV